MMGWSIGIYESHGSSMYNLKQKLCVITIFPDVTLMLFYYLLPLNMIMKLMFQWLMFIVIC